MTAVGGSRAGFRQAAARPVLAEGIGYVLRCMEETERKIMTSEYLNGLHDCQITILLIIIRYMNAIYLTYIFYLMYRPSYATKN